MKLPDIPAKAFSFSAVVVGYLLIDDLPANEQNALGNWLMLVAQVLSTNAFYKQVQKDRYGGSTRESGNADGEGEVNVEMLVKMMEALQKEIENLKQTEL